jgi:hypothetical protein
MANYATVKDGEITGKYDMLPTSIESVSGFHLLADDEETLNSFGWYTVQKTVIPYDPSLQYIIEYFYTFSENKVHEIPQLASYVLPTVEEKFDLALIEVRKERDRRLALSDWTQLADVQAVHDTEWATAWTTYRQELRDIPNRCILGELNIYDFTWPTEP